MIDGQNITLSDGSVKNIKNISVGDMVISYNVISNKKEVKKVIKKKKSFIDRLVKIKLKNGNAVITNEHQPYYVLKDDELILGSLLVTKVSKQISEEINIVPLMLNHHLFNIKDEDVMVESMEILLEPDFIESYEIEIEDNKNFYINNILIRN